MADESVTRVVKRYLQAVAEKGIPVRYGVLFGSHASGYPHAWSDIDLLVVSVRFDGARQREDVNLLWRIAARIDSRIEPIAVGQKQFEQDNSSPIIEIARREGRVVSLTEGRP
jgi:predicted nucleotidyltransferase